MAKKKSSSRRSPKKKATRTSARKKGSSKKKKTASRSASGGRATSSKASRKKTGSKKKAAAGTGKKRVGKSAAASPKPSAAKSSARTTSRKKKPAAKPKTNHTPASPASDATTPTEPPKRPRLTLAPAVEPNGAAPKKVKPSRPVKPPPTAVPTIDREPPTEAELRKVKTGLTRRDKDKYRRLLTQKRHEILGDVESLQTESRTSGGNLSHMPVHMADIGSDNYEQEFTLSLVESERKLLREIDDALQRLSRGTYGVCVQTGTPIAKTRLDAKPWAKYCIEVVRELERLGKL